jgi:ribosomal protein L7Ae-like RNA K-turn-binding protein
VSTGYGGSSAFRKCASTHHHGSSHRHDVHLSGINQCTNVLQRRKENQSTASNGSVKETNPLPSLIILTRDIRPANIMAHIPFYAHLLQIPTLILPGKSSVELGQALGIRSAAVAMFLPSDNSTSIDDSLKEEWKETHEDVDSFVKYVISKIPK